MVIGNLPRRRNPGLACVTNKPDSWWYWWESVVDLIGADFILANRNLAKKTVVIAIVDLLYQCYNSSVQ